MSEQKRGHLRWKKLPFPTGLARVGYGPARSVLHDGITEYATVNPSRVRYVTVGWYFVVPAIAGIAHKNTHGEPCATEAEAKRQAQEYVREQLNKEGRSNG